MPLYLGEFFINKHFFIRFCPFRFIIAEPNLQDFGKNMMETLSHWPTMFTCMQRKIIATSWKILLLDRVSKDTFCAVLGNYCVFAIAVVT